MLKESDLAQLLKRVGTALPAYVANCAVKDLPAVAASDSASSDALSSLAKLVGQSHLVAAAQDMPLVFVLPESLRRRGADGLTILNSLRVASGGGLPDLTSADPLVDALAPMTADLFPLLLAMPHLASDRAWGWQAPISALSTYGHSAEPNFFEVVLSNDGFPGLFPKPGRDPLDTTSYVAASTGRGGTMQLATLPEFVIIGGYSLMRARGGLDEESLRQALADSIDIVRRAVAGELVSVRAFVGFGNVGVPDGTALTLPFGTIRTYPAGADEWVPPEARPATLGNEGIRLGFVLETDYPYSLTVGPWNPSPTPPSVEPPWPAEMEVAQREFAALFEDVPFAFALATQREEPVGCVQTWTSILDPLNAGSSATWRPRSPTAVNPYVATNEDLIAVGEWVQRISDADDSAIEIARRRVVSAIASRDDPTDGFVDAVIAWENLFGSRDGELRFRVSGAIAKLLAEPSDRVAMQRRLQTQYDVRSSVVHGGAHLDSVKARTERDSAIGTALAVLRVLYSERQDLLVDTNRARTVLLS